MTVQPRILVVEDERDLITTVELCLTYNGYRVLKAMDGATGLQMALAERPDLVVLDVQLPEMDGFEVCRRLRALHFDAPILMLTSRSQVENRVTGLNAGADDYLAKPFATSEFLARIQAHLRRQSRTAGATRTLKLGEVEIDLAQKTAKRGAEPLALTKTEFALLDVLARHAGRPVSRESMLDVVWGYTRFPSTRTIDTHIWRLRKKLGDDGETPRWIKQVFGEGYCLVLEIAAPSGPAAELPAAQTRPE